MLLFFFFLFFFFLFFFFFFFFQAEDGIRDFCLSRGLGRLVFEAISAKDEPLVLASVLISTLLLVFGNLVADLLLALVDPRVRLS